MPLRASKMNFFIFGFQRLVWCPKWTPASNNSLTPILSTVIHGLSARRFRRLAIPRNTGFDVMLLWPPRFTRTRADLMAVQPFRHRPRIRRSVEKGAKNNRPSIRGNPYFAPPFFCERIHCICDRKEPVILWTIGWHRPDSFRREVFLHGLYATTANRWMFGARTDIGFPVPATFAFLTVGVHDRFGFAVRGEFQLR